MRPHWDKKAESWDGHLPQSELFSHLRDTVMEVAQPAPSDIALDLGAGSGFLTIPLAERVRRAYAVDHSSEMLRGLHEKVVLAAGEVIAVLDDLRRYEPPEALNLVVSNYALHHLSHSSKRQLLRRCYSWMMPGARIVVADMMVPLTLRPGQSGPLLRRVLSIARRGPAGYLRIAKNVARWAAQRGEYPADRQFWMRALSEARFTGVGGLDIGDESGVVWGLKPPPRERGDEGAEHASDADRGTLDRL
jgi:ubiquinone/menaquinone biosynthesis C-methylase UbiE